MSPLPFKQSAPLTMGVELELQLLNRHNYNLAIDVPDLLESVSLSGLKNQIKLKITQGMIVLKSSIHTQVPTLIEELKELRDAIVAGVKRQNVDISGGGTHPFQRWNEQRVTPQPQFHDLQERYSYLMQFGQHIHIGVECGDDALYLAHALTRYIPHFIALSAASPYYQGLDTNYDSSRSNVVFAFPLSGTLPMITKWAEFELYFDDMLKLKIISSINDFYWDIRPMPEYGTVEIRVCDTPLNLELAALLAGYAKILSRWILAVRPSEIGEHNYMLYQYNRFEASRYGMEGALITEPRIKGVIRNECRIPIYLDLLMRLHALSDYTQDEAEKTVLYTLKNLAYEKNNGAKWLRTMFKERDSLHEVMRLSASEWMKGMELF